MLPTAKKGALPTMLRVSWNSREGIIRLSKATVKSYVSSEVVA
jgi:hypothetical protein